LRQWNRPLDYIEGVVTSVILVSLIILLTHVGTSNEELGPVLRLLVREGLILFLVILLIPMLILHIYAYFKVPSPLSLKIRASCLFGYALLYTFLTVLAYDYYGSASLIWIQTLSLALITGIVYLHVKVRLRYGEYR
jgi:hypothetical protein